LERRIRRDPWKRAAGAALALSVVAGLGVVGVPQLLDLAKPDERGPAGRVDATAAPSPSPAAAPSELEGFFPGFYPVTTYAGAERLQDSVDNGHQPLTLDPAEVARQFARDWIGWQAVELGEATVEGSAAQGWTATVELRPVIGEEQPPTQPGTRHTVELIGLPGAAEPTWFVTGIRSDNIVLGGRPQGPVTSPLTVAGTGIGFEATINTAIKDDQGTTLHPRPGVEEGYVQAGSTEPGPFEGTLAFDDPHTDGGVLVLTGASGLEGPPPDWTVVRLRFAPEAPPPG
ncbi:MAG: Gmad2 immunoglobulin-like domain-containing protein, partial [Actinomycetota bacterium]